VQRIMPAVLTAMQEERDRQETATPEQAQIPD
jgi:hypothetical protein